MDDAGEYVPGDTVNDSAAPRETNKQVHHHTSPDTSHPAGSDNLVNGEHRREGESDMLPESSRLYDRDADGMYKRPVPVPSQRPVRGEEIPNGEQSQPMVIENGVHTTSDTPVSHMVCDELRNGDVHVHCIV